MRCGLQNYFGIHTKWPGSLHDARVWRNSAVFHHLCSRIAGDKVLIADSTYPIPVLLMKPYPESKAAVDPNKRNFNRSLPEERVLIENTFGQLKSTFQMIFLNLLFFMR